MGWLYGNVSRTFGPGTSLVLESCGSSSGWALQWKQGLCESCSHHVPDTLWNAALSKKKKKKETQLNKTPDCFVKKKKKKKKKTSPKKTPVFLKKKKKKKKKK